jgi:hypothetical protein
LNYSETDFIINFDDIWKYVGFARKDGAKKLLEKNFIADIDYKILLLKSAELSTDDKICHKPTTDDEICHKPTKNTKGGFNKDTILLTINTFKGFCLAAGTKKSREIHEYYIKLEKVLYESISEENTDLKNQLTAKDSQLTEKDEKHKTDLKMKKHTTLVELLKTKKCVYIC